MGYAKKNDILSKILAKVAQINSTSCVKVRFTGMKRNKITSNALSLGNRPSRH